MEKDLHKRLEEAAEKIAPVGFDQWGVSYGFKKGAKYGYREAIAQAKEWLGKHIPCIHTHEGDAIYVHGFRHIPMSKFLADFETDSTIIYIG